MKSTWRRAQRAARIAAAGARALLDTQHPILVHVVPMRRCNLACAYCNEYDTVSQPVPLPLMARRLDKLADLGTSMITVSGGEPLMHPELDAMVAQMRRRGMISSVITNGYYLSPERIRRFNEAGLDFLQISIDNVEPDEVSLKSLRLLEPKLKWLAEHALFGVNINSVVGAGIKNPEDADSSSPWGSASSRSIASSSSSGAAATRASTASSRTTWPWDVRTTGAAAPERATSTWTRTAWCTTARRCAGCPAFASRTTAPPTSRVNT